MNNDELILATLKEIRNDQKEMLEQLNKVTTDVSTIQNGFTPHEVVSILHWAYNKRDEEKRQKQTIKSAFISWIVPILCTGLAVGLYTMYK